MVGRQIVDRAKIQRIIFEFDYYEKAFHQFYDTYRQTPGGFSRKECLKHSIFQGDVRAVARTTVNKEAKLDYEVQNLTHQQYCNTISCEIPRKTAKNINDNITGQGVYRTAQIMVKSGLIDKSSMEYDNLKVDPNSTNSCDINVRPGKRQTVNTVHLYHFNKVSFDPNANIHIVGFSKYGTYDYNDSNYGFPNRINQYAGINDYTQSRHELLNFNYAMAVNNNNTLVVRALTPDERLKPGSSSHSDPEAGNNRGATGFISAKMTSELDSKIDDGRPGKGKLLALKSGHARRRGATDGEIKQACYDQDFADVDKAIYNSSTDLKYGCNIIKVMEDVK